MPVADPDVARRSLGDQFLQIPPDDRTWFARACVLAALCLIIVACANMIVIFFAPGNRTGFVSLYLSISVVWVVATFLLSPSWMTQRGQVTAVLVPLIRLGAFGLPLALLAWLVLDVYALTGTSATAVELIGMLAAACGLAAAVVHAWILSDIAEDAELEFSSRAMLTFAWVCPIASVLLWFMPADVTWVDLPIVVLIYLLWSFTLIALAAGLLAMWSYVRWTIRHAMQRIEREISRSTGEASREFPVPADARTDGPPPQRDRDNASRRRDEEDDIPLA